MSEPISAIPPLTVQAERVDHQRTNQLKAPSTDAGERVRDAKLRKAAQDFESLFMYKLLKSMRATVPKSNEAGFGMETMRDITDEQMAVHLAQQGGIGLGDMLYESLNRQHPAAEQEKQADDSSRPDDPAVEPAAGHRQSPEEISRPQPSLGLSNPIIPVVRSSTDE